MRGPKPETLNLNEAEQNVLKALVHRHTTPQQQALLKSGSRLHPFIFDEPR